MEQLALPNNIYMPPNIEKNLCIVLKTEVTMLLPDSKRFP
jgi:hypothetical protein